MFCWGFHQVWTILTRKFWVLPPGHLSMQRCRAPAANRLAGLPTTTALGLHPRPTRRISDYTDDTDTDVRYFMILMIP